MIVREVIFYFPKRENSNLILLKKYLGHISLPGTIGAMLIERPASVDGFSQQAPLVYHFGHTAPNANLPLFNLLISKLSEVISERMQANKKG